MSSGAPIGMARCARVAVAVPFLASASACSTGLATAPGAAPAAALSGDPPVAAAAVELAPPAPPTSVLDGIYTEAQAGRGRAVYGENCAECHGEGLGGGEMAPGLTGVAFSFRWRGLKVGNVYTSIRSTMPPEEPGRLSAQEYIDIVAFLLGATKYPAGDRELAADVALLEGIAVERMPP